MLLGPRWAQELEIIRDASEPDTSLDRVVRAIDDELVGHLRKEQGVLSILDSYLPRRGQKWNDLLEIRNEDEQSFYGDLGAKKVELVGILLNFIDELKSDLQQSKSIEASRTGDVQPVETTRYSLVKVFFATDRELTADAEYLGKMSRMIVQKEVPLQYGWVEVGIPADHSLGILEAPQKRLSEEADPSKHVVIFSVDTELRGNLQGFLEVVNKDLSSGDLLVYIHGYKTSHLKAVKQAAQLKYDLKFKGTIILYSWSSAGTVCGYYTDEKNIKKAAVSLHKLLKSIMNEVNLLNACKCSVNRFDFTTNSVNRRASHMEPTNMIAKSERTMHSSAVYLLLLWQIRRGNFLLYHVFRVKPSSA